MSDDRVFAKCALRLMPILIAVYAVNSIDKVNVGFAALTMNKDLGFSPSVYGLGAGILFASYSLFQVPNTVMLARAGIRRWYFVILTVWGALSAATSLVRAPEEFYVVRFFLGAAEAGVFSGSIYYLTLWFPDRWRGRMSAWFFTSVLIAAIAAGPVSTTILQLDGAAGLRGWQWLFLLEAAPAWIMAAVVLLALPDRPSDARWLRPEEKQLIAARLGSEIVKAQNTLWRSFYDTRVLALCLVYFLLIVPTFAFDLWAPQIVKALGFSTFATGFVVAIPFAASAIPTVWWGRLSDRRGERVWHLSAAVLFSAAGFLIAAGAPSVALGLVGLIVARVGLSAVYGPFFGLAASFLRDDAAAGGLSLISVAGGIGGFVGTTLTGILRQQSGGYTSAMIALCFVLVVACAVVLALGRAMMHRALTQEVHA
jgi:MFS transporter, ACS family, tartrate transporter